VPEEPELAVAHMRVPLLLLCTRWKEALRELDIAQQTSVPLNVFIYGAAITAMSRSGRYAEGCALLDKMLAAGLKANVITYNAAMSGCAKCGKWQEVSRLCLCKL
jgi:pentatricopeptide repeat domain-containing protein 1